MSLLAALAPHLPYLRRYARALTGDQDAGDRLVKAALTELATGERQLASELSPRVGLYNLFHQTLGEADRTLAISPGEPEGARERLLRLAPASRQAFLLTALEGFGHGDACRVLGVGVDELEALILAAQTEIQAELATEVLIIEDQPVIAADLAAIVEELGHLVSDLASTREEAVTAAARRAPGLVLADIQLADGSSGIDAVRDILTEIPVPVIFITAFPERLLTGEKPEPAFLITKPFDPGTVKATIGQALFFHPRRTHVRT